MEHVKLTDINLFEIGHKIQIAGLIMSNEHTDYYCYLPDQNVADNVKFLEMSLNEWEQFIRQTDLLETEILAKDKTGKLAKVILRKSNRQVDAGVSWKVFQRDNYSCRYCGITGVPLTIDHLVTWESGGPTIVDNLVAACRKCNKLRGDLDYSDWLKSEDYLARSVNLAQDIVQKNKDVLGKLSSIPRKSHIISR